MPALDPNVRFCNSCNMSYLDAKYRFFNSSQDDKKQSRLFLICLAALAVAVVLLVTIIIIAASQDIKIWVKNPGAAYEGGSDYKDFQKNKHLYEQWKDSGMPDDNTPLCKVYERYSSKKKECEAIMCPDYSFLDVETGVCRQTNCGYDFYLDVNGKDCHLNCTEGYKANWMGNGCTEKCRVHEVYNATDGGCDEIECPRTTQLNKRTGACDPIICEPWERHSLDGLSCEFRCRSTYFYDNATDECLPKECPDYFYASDDGKECLTKECPDYFHLAKNG